LHIKRTVQSGKSPFALGNFSDIVVGRARLTTMQTTLGDAVADGIVCSGLYNIPNSTR